jgi:hypothetical protein
MEENQKILTENDVKKMVFKKFPANIFSEQQKNNKEVNV